MSRIRVEASYDGAPAEVWSVLEPIESHVDWMADAEVIRFSTDRTRGVGTRFECVTKVGPIRLTDQMEITEWDPARSMGVHHAGLVTGDGRFTIAPLGGGNRSRFSWEEELTFPWWLAGRVGSAIGGPAVLKRIWQGNLRRLKPLVERRR